MATLPDISLNGLNKLNLTGIIPSKVFGVSWLVIIDIIIGMILVLWLLWYINKRGKSKYNIQIYERDSSGIPIPIDTDVLSEKTINKGKNTIYMLKKYNTFAYPPTSKFIYQRKKTFFGTELWCDYLRERQDFIPIKRVVELGLNTQLDVGEYTKNLQEIYESKPEEVKKGYIYSPIIPQSLPKLKFEPMEYSMAEMLQVRHAHRELLYADRQNFMQTYGPTIGIGLAAVAIIVVAFLSYQFASKSITDSTNYASSVAKELGGVASALANRPLNSP